ncbi:MAG: MMPL family transporter [Bauldia sp.]|nr:MMPL family transporter [Bauldia sp.]
MAVHLYRLGRFAFRNRWAVLGAWILILIGAGTAAVTLSGPTQESFSIPGVPAIEALELQNERFAPPGAAADGPAELPASAQIVFAAPEGETLATPERLAAISTLLTTLAGAPEVAAVQPGADAMAAILTGAAAAAGMPVLPGIVSPDGRIAQAQATYAVPAIALTEEARHALEEAVATARATGLEVEIGGDVLQEIPETPITEALGLLVAAVVLVVTLGSLVAAGLPLLTGLLGVGIGVALVTAATGFIELSSTAPVLATMLGLAVAIDYALFILTRYRKEMQKGLAPEEAAGRAVGTAGSAVVFAGLTVIIALAGLAVVNISFLAAMGLAAAFTVAIAVLIALTLLPAMIGFGRNRILGRRGAAPRPANAPAPAGERWGRFVTRNRLAVLVVAILGLGVVATPALDLDLALPGPATASPESTERKAYDLVSEGFGPGFNGQLIVVVDAAPAADRPAAIAAVGEALAGIDGIAAFDAVGVNPAGDTALYRVVPTTGPVDPATKELVQRIRTVAVSGAVLGVTGLPAIEQDVSQRLADALVPYMLVVVGLAILLLLLVFRSILVPIKATLGFLLTIGATFGAVVAVFQWGWLGGLIGLESTGPVMSMLPIFMIGVVFGLAMDYQVFLVTPMREEYVHGASATEATVRGVTVGARVVTAAALIMISVFAGFVLAGDPIIKSLGFAMAFGVFIDAFVVRLTIVPAFMALVGRGAWWIPRWLDRVLPNVDVEGERLGRVIGATPASQPAE